MTLFGLNWPFAKIKNVPIHVSKDEATTLWLDGFKEGFSKAWDFMPEASKDVRQKIESRAIDETLRRLNGNLLSKN